MFVLFFHFNLPFNCDCGGTENLHFSREKNCSVYKKKENISEETGGRK